MLIKGFAVLTLLNLVIAGITYLLYKTIKTKTPESKKTAPTTSFTKILYIVIGLMGLATPIVIQNFIIQRNTLTVILEICLYLIYIINTYSIEELNIYTDNYKIQKKQIERLIRNIKSKNTKVENSKYFYDILPYAFTIDIQDEWIDKLDSKIAKQNTQDFIEKTKTIAIRIGNINFQRILQDIQTRKQNNQ